MFKESQKILGRLWSLTAQSNFKLSIMQSTHHYMGSSTLELRDPEKSVTNHNGQTICQIFDKDKFIFLKVIVFIHLAQ